MDNETNEFTISNKIIERIIMYISDIFEKIIESDNSPFIIIRKDFNIDSKIYFFFFILIGINYVLNF